ncbi:MAG TPA: EthD domain-containing protein [Thermoanaerobaculia bacterium]|nr:EthD domain-containing protein [Thermoanaerobaculia bacterium]
MIKLVYCITRKPGLSDQEFFHYWKDVHGPLGARIPGLRKLVQSHTLKEPGKTGPPEYDGMAELWFDDLAALATARNSAEWQASTADERNFLDPGKVALFLTEEHEIV